MANRYHSANCSCKKCLWNWAWCVAEAAWEAYSFCNEDLVEETARSLYRLMLEGHAVGYAEGVEIARAVFYSHARR